MSAVTPDIEMQSASVAETGDNIHREDHGEAPEGLIGQTKELLSGSYFNVLLVFTPLAFLAAMSKWSDAATFVFSFLALIPLAALLGDLTEDLALRTNDAIGALINVTFGNATELIISVAALRYEMYDIIKFSLLGSVLGNMLLVLGSSMVVAGRKYPVLQFNPAGANTYLPMLLLSTFGFVVPTAFFTLPMATEPVLVLRVSQDISVVMVIVYAAYLYFQLFTHKSIFDGADNEEDEEEAKFSFAYGIIAIGVVAVLISACSEFLVDSLEGAAESMKLSRHLIGVIIVPIVGNVAEHASAIVMAAKNKLDISLGVALGSSIQISMFAMPLLVIISWIFGYELDMHFSAFATSTLFASVVLCASTITSGQANWLSGMKLLAAYIFLVVAFAHAPDPLPKGAAPVAH